MDLSCPLVDMHCHCNTHPNLDQMVDHEGADASSSPLGVNQQEGDIGLVVLHVWNHETKTNHHFFIQGNHAEIRVLQTL